MSYSDTDLSDIEYIRRLKKYEFIINNPYRNYLYLKNALNDINAYKPQHAAHFIKKIKKENDMKNCEAVFTEIIVYVFYLRLLHEEIVKSLDRQEDDYDLKIELVDGTFNYLEILSIMPLNKISTPDNIIVNKVETHLKDSKSSAYQKILDKITKQKQFTKNRQNYAVIEINDLFDMNIVVLNPIFNEPITKYIKGIILFHRGDYSNRDCIINPYFINK